MTRIALFLSRLAASGAVKYVYDLSGYVETVLALRNVKLPPDDSQNLAQFCDMRRQLVTCWADATGC